VCLLSQARTDEETLARSGRALASLTFIRGLAGMLISLHLTGLVPRLHQNNHMNPHYSAWDSKVDVLGCILGYTGNNSDKRQVNVLEEKSSLFFQ